MELAGGDMNQSKLKVEAELCASKIKNAKLNQEYFEEPFRHIVIDNFFSHEIAASCLDNFPDVNSGLWDYQDTKKIEIKYRTKWTSEFDIPDGIVDAVRIMNSSLFLSAASEKIGIKKLISDPYFTGGGLNLTKNGGMLGVHVDGNYHDATSLNRRLNAIVYLNPGWENSWGGEFGVYDNAGKVCLKKIAPIFNRLVIFDSHDFSFHGLPEPINFPGDVGRKSIILYYYTKESRPANQVSVETPHSALWVETGMLDKSGNKSRNFY